jgi:hypothetical protein
MRDSSFRQPADLIGGTSLKQGSVCLAESQHRSTSCGTPQTQRKLNKLTDP